MVTDDLQLDIDNKNQSYWNELCGSSLAKHLGVTDSSIPSLLRFDQFYFDYYPYLFNYLPKEKITNKTVLEVGLGYGTMAQYLAQCGADYYGLDIAKNAVAMAQHRLQQNNLQGTFHNGSMLSCPFPDSHFDWVISIGCFHHTGSVSRCVDQTYRVLKPGGRAVIMVYNKFSLRQWVKWPKASTQSLLLQLLGMQALRKASAAESFAYDATTDGLQAAPETEFFSKAQLRTIFKKFNTVTITRENFDDQFKIGYGKRIGIRLGKRSDYLNNAWSKYLGLDLYIEAIK